MSNCKYYNIFKRKIKCLHPTYGGINTSLLNNSYGSNRCDECKRMYGGIYPSELPVIDMRSEEIDVVDKYGRILNR